MNRDMVNAAYDLGATQVQMLKEIMLPVSDTSHYCWLLYGLTYSARRLCRDLLCNRKWFYNLVCVEIYSRARQGISLSINALSALVFLFSVLLVIGYYFITRERRKQHEKLYSFLTGIVLVILVLWGISHQIEASMNTKNSDKLVIYNWGDYIDPELLTEFTKETGDSGAI